MLHDFECDSRLFDSAVAAAADDDDDEDDADDKDDDMDDNGCRSNDTEW